jgi:hypothetical protein
VDEFLPIWKQPHRFYLLDQGQREVFTFGLVMTELRSLKSVGGVRSFGRRFGFEWLPGLARGVRRESDASDPKFPSGELETFLFEAHGFRTPREFELDHWASAQENAGSEPPDAALREFARTDGVGIANWSRQAFRMFELNLFEWARARERVPIGYGRLARGRLSETQMAHTLESFHGLGGGERWGRGYESLYERVALELEDLAILRPKPRVCPLCQRVYIPLRANQSVCSNQVWDVLSRQLVRRCTPASERAWDDVEAADYRRRRKTRWMAMNRARARYGPRDPRTADALASWDAWRRANPPSRPPGRPLKSTPAAEPPFHPTGKSD